MPKSFPNAAPTSELSWKGIVQSKTGVRGRGAHYGEDFELIYQSAKHRFDVDIRRGLGRLEWAQLAIWEARWRFLGKERYSVRP